MPSVVIQYEISMNSACPKYLNEPLVRYPKELKILIAMIKKVYCVLCESNYSLYVAQQ